MCNLQTSGYQWSISGLVREVNLVCLGTVNSGNGANTHQEFLKVELNNVTLDVRLKGTIHKDRQASFLFTGDRRTKRLSFLWPSCGNMSDSDIPVCGCYGGCQFTSSDLYCQAKLQESDKPFAIEEEEQASTAAVFDIINPCDIAKIHSFLFSIPLECLSHKLRQTADHKMLSHEMTSFERGSITSLDSFHSALSHVSKSEHDAGCGRSSVNDPAQDTLNQQGNTALSLTEYSQSVHSLPVAHGAENVGHISLRTFTSGCSTPFPSLHWCAMKKQVPVDEQDMETESEVSIQVELKDSLTIKAVPQAFQILSK